MQESIRAWGSRLMAQNISIASHISSFMAHVSGLQVAGRWIRIWKVWLKFSDFGFWLGCMIWGVLAPLHFASARADTHFSEFAFPNIYGPRDRGAWGFGVCG